MFPPPQPWKTLAEVEPEGAYVAFTSRFALRSVFQLPSFTGWARKIAQQVERAPGAIGYSLGANLLTLELYTLSAWDTDAHLHAFVTAQPHSGAAIAFRDGVRKPSIFVRWTIRGSDLPLSWSDALRRQRAQED